MAAVMLTLAAAVPASAAASPPMPTDQARVVWQHVCEHAAGGTLSDQVALVCTHSGFPMWEARQLALLERVCTAALKGTYQYRSEFPTEFAACFFD